MTTTLHPQTFAKPTSRLPYRNRSTCTSRRAFLPMTPMALSLLFGSVAASTASNRLAANGFTFSPPRSFATASHNPPSIPVFLSFLDLLLFYGLFCGLTIASSLTMTPRSATISYAISAIATPPRTRASSNGSYRSASPVIALHLPSPSHRSSTSTTC